MLSRTKYLLIALLPFFTYAESSMKCEAGKCSSGDVTSKKTIPLKESSASAMKCEAGKCGSSMTTTEKKVEKSTTSKTPTIKQLFNVKTVEVKSLNTAKEQINYGYIVAQDSSMVDVTTWYSGFVETLYADSLYKKVKKGDALAKVYSPEVYKAKQDYINSLNYNMKTSMPEMLKSAKIKLRLLGVSEKEINAITSKRDANTFTTVYAPISGWIFEKNINNGSSFNSKKRLFQIVNLDKVWMEVKLFQNELKTLASLEEHIIKIKGIETVFNAKKSLLYPMLDPKEATATLRLTINNTGELLKPGMYAKVHSTTQRSEKLIIPRTAAMRKSGIWYVFLATEFKGEYEPLEVELTPLDNKHFEVTKGLVLGDKIVNNALFMMDSDAQINSIY